MKKQRKYNFVSTFETECTHSPHHVYTSLAIDAALLAMNDQLPDLSDEENQRILDAAHYAAQAVLALARVPDDWISIVATLNYKREEKLRSELWDAVFELLPETDKGLEEDRKKAEERILACALPAKKEAVQRALWDLSNANLGMDLQTAYAAFTLGFEVAHDPTRLLLEKARAE